MPLRDGGEKIAFGGHGRSFRPVCLVCAWSLTKIAGRTELRRMPEKGNGLRKTQGRFVTPRSLEFWEDDGLHIGCLSSLFDGRLRLAPFL
jgi:hypothetical protein